MVIKTHNRSESPSLLLNIENLDPAYITVMMKQAAAAAAAGTGTEG